MSPHDAHAPVDQDDGFAGSSQLVDELETADVRPLHPYSVFLVNTGAS